MFSIFLYAIWTYTGMYREFLFDFRTIRQRFGFLNQKSTWTRRLTGLANRFPCRPSRGWAKCTMLYTTGSGGAPWIKFRSNRWGVVTSYKYSSVILGIVSCRVCCLAGFVAKPSCALATTRQCLGTKNWLLVTDLVVKSSWRIFRDVERGVGCYVLLSAGYPVHP